jgi:hypothetical protein
VSALTCRLYACLAFFTIWGEEIEIVRVLGFADRQHDIPISRPGAAKLAYFIYRVQGGHLTLVTLSHILYVGEPQSDMLPRWD